MIVARAARRNKSETLKAFPLWRATKAFPDQIISAYPKVVVIIDQYFAFGGAEETQLSSLIPLAHRMELAAHKAKKGKDCAPPVSYITRLFKFIFTAPASLLFSSLRASSTTFTSPPCPRIAAPYFFSSLFL